MERQPLHDAHPQHQQDNYKPMNKTIPITIAGQLFYIEEDAYQKLHTYLEAIKARFNGDSDQAEIIADIEGRIREHFMEDKTPGEHYVVNNSAVEKLISSMGQPEDFGGDETKQSTPSGKTGARKLYRNPDDVMIAGVASGLAAYFDIDPLIVRVIFGFSLLIGGGGIVAYIVLWLIMPLAETSSEKLHMRGQAVTVDSITATIKDRAEELKKNSGKFNRLLKLPGMVISGIFKLVRGLFKIIFRLAGAIMSVSGAIALVAVSMIFAASVFNIHSSYIDFPIGQILKGAELALVSAAGFFAIFVPLVFILLIGISLMLMRSIFRALPSITLIGIWFAALVTLAAITPSVAEKYQQFIDTDPAYQVISRGYDAKDFTSIIAENGVRVTLKQADNFSTEAKGRLRDVERISATVKDGVLVLQRNEKNKVCIFCFSSPVDITVTAPTVTEIHTKNGSRFTAEKFSGTDLKTYVENGSRLILEGKINTLNAYAENGSSVTVTGWATTTNFSLENGSNITFTGNTVNFSSTLENGSRLSATGTSTKTTIITRNGSHFSGENFKSEDVSIEASNGSRIEIDAVKNLTIKASNGSTIIYSGSPVTNIIKSNGSRVTPAWTDRDENIDLNQN